MVKRNRIKYLLPSLRKCVIFAFILLVAALTFFISKDQISYANEEINIIAHFQAYDNMHLLIYDGDNFTGENDVTLRCTIQAGEDSCQTWLPKLYEQVDGSHKYGNRLVWKADSYDYKRIIQTEIVPQFNVVDKITFTRADVVNNHITSFYFVAYHYYEYTATFVPGHNINALQQTSSSELSSEGYQTTCRTYMLTFADDNDSSTPGCSPLVPYQVRTPGGILSGSDGRIGYRSVDGDEDLGRSKILGIFEDTYILVDFRFYRYLRFNANGNQIQYNGTTSWNGSEEYSCYTYSSQGTCTIPNYRPPVISQVPEGYTLKGYSTDKYKMLNVGDYGYNGLTPLINNNIGQEIEQPLTLGNGQDELIFYAISTKTVTATFNPNGNTNTQAATQTCERSAGYPCEVTAPTINTQPNTPVVIGWSPTQNTETIKSKNPNFRQPSNVSMEYWVHNDTYQVHDNITLYAHTMSEKKTYTGYFARATEGDPNLTSSCTIGITYNNVAQATSCQTGTPYYNYPSGYKNARWTDGTNYYEYPSQVTLSQETTHFSWAGEPNTSTLRFNANGGNGSMNSITVRHGEQVTLPTNTFTYEGKIFTGWNTKANGSGTSYTDGQAATFTITSDGNTIDLYAQWETLYTITYNCTLNGGTCDINTPGYKPAGAKADLDRTATKAGYEFVGWSTISNAHEALSTYTVTGEVTLYAIFVKTVTYIFKPNGATLYGTQSFSCQAYNDATGCSLRFSSPMIRRDGYQIIGFNTSPTDTTNPPAINESASITIPNAQESKTFYAITYANASVTFNDNKGNTVIGDNTYSCQIIGTQNNCENTIPDFNPIAKKKLGYTTSANYSSSDTLYKVGDTLPLQPNQTLTLYAHSSNTAKTYTATFNYLNGTATVKTCTIAATYDTATQATSCSITAPTLTQRTGYIAPVWKNGDTTINSDASITVTHDISFAETQTPITYTVKFNANGGQGSMTNQVYAYGQSYNLPANTFTHGDNYAFRQWCTEANGGGTCYDDKASVKNLSATNNATITLYAIWSHYVNITFNATENGGTTSVSSKRGVAPYQVTLDSSLKASKNGYEFIGWNTNKNATDGLSSYEATENTTLYAIFKKTITVTFDKNGAAELQNIPIPTCTAYNKTTTCSVDFTAPAIIPRTTFNVIGFGDSADAHTAKFQSNGLVHLSLSGSVTYYAVTYADAKATFDGNGNAIIGDTVKSCKIYNTANTCNITTPDFTPTAATKLGYTQGTYYPSSSSSFIAVKTTLPLNPGDDKTYYAHSTNAAISYKITYKYRDGTKREDNCVISENYNTSTSPSSCHATTPLLPETIGYRSPKWQYNNRTINGGDDITITQDTTLTEIHDPIQYTIKFDANGGQGTMPDQIISYDQSYQLPVHTFTPPAEDYYFEQWCTTAGSAISCSPEKDTIKNLSTIDGTVIVYKAMWKQYQSVPLTIKKSDDDQEPKTVKCIFINDSSCIATMPDPANYPKANYRLSGYNLLDPDAETGLSENDLTYDPLTRILTIKSTYAKLAGKTLSVTPSYTKIPEEVKTKDGSGKLPNTGDTSPFIFTTIALFAGSCIALGARFLLKRR